MPPEQVVSLYLNALSNGDYPGVRALLANDGTFGKDNLSADAYVAQMAAGPTWHGVTLLKATYSGLEASILYQGNDIGMGQPQLGAEALIIEGGLIRNIRGMTIGVGGGWLDPGQFSAMTIVADAI